MWGGFLYTPLQHWTQFGPGLTFLTDASMMGSASAHSSQNSSRLPADCCPSHPRFSACTIIMWKQVCHWCPAGPPSFARNQPCATCLSQSAASSTQLSSALVWWSLSSGPFFALKDVMILVLTNLTYFLRFLDMCNTENDVAVSGTWTVFGYPAVAIELYIMVIEPVQCFFRGLHCGYTRCWHSLLRWFCVAVRSPQKNMQPSSCRLQKPCTIIASSEFRFEHPQND